MQLIMLIIHPQMSSSLMKVKFNFFKTCTSTLHSQIMETLCTVLKPKNVAVRLVEYADYFIPRLVIAISEFRELFHTKMLISYHV